MTQLIWSQGNFLLLYLKNFINKTKQYFKWMVIMKEIIKFKNIFSWEENMHLFFKNSGRADLILCDLSGTYLPVYNVCQIKFSTLFRCRWLTKHIFCQYGSYFDAFLMLFRWWILLFRYDRYLLIAYTGYNNKFWELCLRKKRKVLIKK